MKLRCKPGDLAIVIRDDVGYEANLGRFVRVSGPVETDRRGMRTWLIEPVDARAWAVGPPGAVPTYMTVRFRDLVEHPDQWLLPVRGRKPRLRSKRTTARRTDTQTDGARTADQSRRESDAGKCDISRRMMGANRAVPADDWRHCQDHAASYVR